MNKNHCTCNNCEDCFYRVNGPTCEGSICICGEIVWGNGLCPDCTRKMDSKGIQQYTERYDWQRDEEWSQEDGYANLWQIAGFVSKDPNDWTRLIYPTIQWNSRN